jgi:hypothetical protein
VHAASQYLYQYTNEMAWREDHRRQPNGTNWRLVTECRSDARQEPDVVRLLAEGRGVTDHVVSTLIEKRRELAGIIDNLQRRLDQHRANLVHDGVVRVLASDIDPERLKPKRLYRRNRYFARNELSRLCLSVRLRIA